MTTTTTTTTGIRVPINGPDLRTAVNAVGRFRDPLTGIRFVLDPSGSEYRLRVSAGNGSLVATRFVRVRGPVEGLDMDAGESVDFVSTWKSAKTAVTGIPASVVLDLESGTIGRRSLETMNRFAGYPDWTSKSAAGIVTIDAEDLIGTPVTRAAGTDDGRPVLMHVMLQQLDRVGTDYRVRVAATDSYRLYWRDIETRGQGGDLPTRPGRTSFDRRTLAVPVSMMDSRGLEVVRRTRGDNRGLELSVSSDGTVVRVAGPYGSIVSSTLEGSYPNIDTLIREDSETDAVLEVLDMETLVARLEVLETIAGSEGGRDYPVQLMHDGTLEVRFGENGVSVRADTAPIGDMTVPDGYTSNELKHGTLVAAFNPGYLRDAVSDGGQCVIRFGSHLQPAMIRTSKGLNVLVMPVRM